jgi:ParB family chromosome partitioning protein
MEMRIDQIRIKKRVRKNLGDLESLKKSLQQYGLMNPIMVNGKNELIAGHRRLEAAKLLGWEFIEAMVMDKAGELVMLELEIEENVQ